MSGLGLQASVLQLFRNVVQDRQEEDATVDLQVGKTVHSGLPRRMRTELWMSVLLRKGVGTAAAKQYRTMLAKPVPIDVQENIEKDIGRTYPGVARFATREGKWDLFCVLRAYAAYDEEVNYCQGMNFLAGLLLTYVDSQSAAFGLLVILMHERGLRTLYKTDLSMLQARLWQLGQLMPGRLRLHMEQQGALPVLYASAWLLTAFASDFPLFFAARVMDVILADCYIEPMMKVALGILWQVGGTLLRLQDMEPIVEVLKVGVLRLPRETLQALLSKALARDWTPAQAGILAQVDGVETVKQAVRRISQTGPGLPKDAQGSSVVGQATSTAASPPVTSALPATAEDAGTSVLEAPLRGPIRQPSWAMRLSAAPVQLPAGLQHTSSSVSRRPSAGDAAREVAGTYAAQSAAQPAAAVPSVAGVDVPLPPLRPSISLMDDDAAASEQPADREHADAQQHTSANGAIPVQPSADHECLDSSSVGSQPDDWTAFSAHAAEGLSMAAAVSTLAGPSALPRRLAHQHSSDSHASFGSFEGGTPREQGMASSPVQKLAAPCSRDPFGLASLDQVSPLHEPVNGTGADAAARHAPERWAGSAEAGTECQLSGMHSRRGKAGHEAVSCPPAPVDRERRGIAGADIFESLSSLSFGEGRATWHGSSRTRRVPEQIAPTNPAHTLQLPVSQNSGYRERQRTPYAMAGAGLESI